MNQEFFLLYLWRWIHEMKWQQVNNTKRFKKENNICQVCSLDFRHRCCQQLIFVLTVCIQPISLTVQSKNLIIWNIYILTDRWNKSTKYILKKKKVAETTFIGDHTKKIMMTTMKPHFKLKIQSSCTTLLLLWIIPWTCDTGNSSAATYPGPVLPALPDRWLAFAWQIVTPVSFAGKIYKICECMLGRGGKCWIFSHVDLQVYQEYFYLDPFYNSFSFFVQFKLKSPRL